MSTNSSLPTRRGVLAAAAGAVSLLPIHLAAAGGPAALGIAVLAGQCMPASAAGDTAIRPFQVHVPDAALVDLHRRIADTRWPDKETVTDRSQGNQLGKHHNDPDGNG